MFLWSSVIGLMFKIVHMSIIIIIRIIIIIIIASQQPS